MNLLSQTNGSYYGSYDPEIYYNKKTSVKSIFCVDFEDPYSDNLEDDRDSNLEHLFSIVENFTEIILKAINMLSDDFYTPYNT